MMMTRFPIVGEDTNVENGKARKNPEVLDWNYRYH